MAPEKLNLWDRLFNRYRREIHERGTEVWMRRMRDWTGAVLEKYEYHRQYIEYRITDRVTGSERIEKQYLN